MSYDQTKVAEEIASAFGRTQPPVAKSIIDTTSLEAIRVKNFFSGKAWWDVTLDALQNDYGGDGSACLSFMAPEAFIYYLPSYLTISCLHYHEADAISGEFIYKLIRPVSNANDKFSQSLTSLSDSRQKAIAHFLMFISENYQRFERHDAAAEALSLFWDKFLI